MQTQHKPAWAPWPPCWQARAQHRSAQACRKPQARRHAQGQRAASASPTHAKRKPNAGSACAQPRPSANPHH
eukprot:7921045-Alexandrium_andersonii.AAC.1